MPKTLFNSTRCSCCHRLLPRKTSAKRRYCGVRCSRIGKARKAPPGRGPAIANGASGHRAGLSRADFFPSREIRCGDPVSAQKPEIQPNRVHHAAAAVFGSETVRAEFVPAADPATPPGLRVTLDLGLSWGACRERHPLTAAHEPRQAPLGDAAAPGLGVVEAAGPGDCAPVPGTDRSKKQ